MQNRSVNISPSISRLGQLETVFRDTYTKYNLLDVKTRTLVVLLSLSLFTLITQVITMGASSDLFGKVWVTAYKDDTY